MPSRDQYNQVRNCERCNQPFTITGAKHRICPSCKPLQNIEKDRARRLKRLGEIERILCACGCGRDRPRFDLAGRERLYISGHNESGPPRRCPKLCLICGEEFQPRNRAQILCSSACRDKRNSLPRPSRRQKALVERTCEQCGATFRRLRGELRRRSGLYCSEACRDKWLGQRRASQPADPIRAANARDGHRCRICGFDAVISTHHIEPFAEGGTDALPNLITLCPNHHAMADRGLISRDELRNCLAGVRHPENVLEVSSRTRTRMKKVRS